MRRCGYSDKMFYYNGSGEGTYSMRLRYELSITLTKEMLEAAVRKTFSCFPEYRVRPVLWNEKIYYEENPLPVPVFWNESGNAGHFYGSDEVNGYLYVISGEEHAVTVSQYHGITDFTGYLAVVHTLFMHLMAEAGISVADPLARVDSSLYDSMDICEREDPYSKYADANAESAFSYRSRGALAIPAKGEPRTRFFDLVVSERAFGAKVKEIDAGFVPFMSMLFAWAANEVYGIGEAPVVIKVPIDMRRIFKNRTTVNFSDSAILDYPREYLSLSKAEQGKALKEMLQSQLIPGNFERIMARKIHTIQQYEQSGQTIGEICRSISGNASTSSRPVTLGFTNLGRMTFPEPCQAFVTDVVPCCYTPTNGIFAVILSSGDKLKLHVQTMYEHVDFINALAEEMRKLGLDVEVGESFLDQRDIMDESRLKKIQG